MRPIVNPSLKSLKIHHLVSTKHLRIQNKTKRIKTKLIHHFDFGQPKQNKIMILKILFDQNRPKSKQNQPKPKQNMHFGINFVIILVSFVQFWLVLLNFGQF